MTFKTGDIITLPYPNLKSFRKMPFLQLVEKNSRKRFFVVLDPPIVETTSDPNRRIRVKQS